MGKTGNWMHSIKKAVRKHLHGDLDPYKFQHLPAKGTTPRAHSDCSTASSHVGDEHYLEDGQSGSSSLIVGGSSHKQEEKRRSSTSSQVSYGGSGHHEKSPKHDDVTSSRSDTASSQENGGSGRRTYEESLKDDFPRSSSRSCEKGTGNHNYKVEINDSGHHRDAERRRGERSSGDHSHLVKLYREERAGPSTSYNPFYDRSNKEENGRSSTSSEKGRGVGEELSGTASEKENPRYSTGGRGGHNEEKRRPSISSQKERSDHEKPPVDKGRLSNASSAHHERSTVEKARSSTSSNHKVKTSLSSSDNRRPSTPSSPDDRTKSLLNENWKMPSENRRLSTDKGRPKTPSSPRVTFVTPAVSTETILLEKSISIVGPAASQALKSPSFGAPTPASPYAQQGRSIAVQDLLKPPSFERKSSSSSTTSVYQAGGSTRSITSDGSNSSEDFLELVFPLSDPNRTSPSFQTSTSTNQRKKVVITTVHDLFSSHQFEAPVSPGSQRRKSGNFSAKPVVSLPELGTKPLLPPNYRKQQAPVAVPLADLGAVMFHAGDAGAGGMLKEWAAVLIQSSWRRYIARRTFKALRGLLKLQALVRGYLVRKRIKPLVNARIQAARVRNKLSRNTKVSLHHVSNEYGISPALLDNQSCQYGSAQPVLDDLPTPATRKSSRTRDPLKCDVSDWNSPVTLCTLAELKLEVLMKKQRAKQQQTLSTTCPEGQNPELRTEGIFPLS